MYLVNSSLYLSSSSKSTQYSSRNDNDRWPLNAVIGQVLIFLFFTLKVFVFRANFKFIVIHLTIQMILGTCSFKSFNLMSPEHEHFTKSPVLMSPRVQSLHKPCNPKITISELKSLSHLEETLALSVTISADFRSSDKSFLQQFRLLWVCQVRSSSLWHFTRAKVMSASANGNKCRQSD